MIAVVILLENFFNNCCIEESVIIYKGKEGLHFLFKMYYFVYLEKKNKREIFWKINSFHF